MASKKTAAKKAPARKASPKAKPSRTASGASRGAPAQAKKGKTAEKIEKRGEVIDKIMAMASDAGLFPAARGGRPSEYDERLCEAVVIHAASTGLSLTAFAGDIGVNRDTLTEWGKKHPEFSVAMARAKAARAAYLERQAMNGLNAAWVNYRVLALKNCAPDDFREVTDVRHGGLPGAPPITTATIDVTKLTPQQQYEYVMNGAALPEPAKPDKEEGDE